MTERAPARSHLFRLGAPVRPAHLDARRARETRVARADMTRAVRLALVLVLVASVSTSSTRAEASSESVDYRARRATHVDDDVGGARATTTCEDDVGTFSLERSWRATAHTSVYATPWADDVERDGRGAVVAQTTSGRVRAFDGGTGVDLEGNAWGARHGRSSRAGVVRVGDAWVSVSLDGDVRAFDARGTRARATLAPLAMEERWYDAIESPESSPVDPRESERRHEARHRAPESGGGERRLLGRLDGEDEDATTTTTSAAEEARSDRGWDVGEDASVAEEEDSSLRVVKDGHVFVDAHVLCSPSVGDVDGDGKLEIVFAVSYYFDAHARFDGDVDPSKYAASGLVILDGESLVTKRSVVLDRSAATAAFKAKAYASPTLADLNTDGRRDIIIGTYAGVLHVVDGASGEPMRGWPRKLGQMEAQVVAVDVDADGAIELIACDVRGTMAVFKSTGVEAWEKHLKSRIAVAASVGDVDGDGLLDIVVGTTSGVVHAFRARDGAGRERWPIDVGDKILAPLVLTKLRPKKTGLDVLVATHEGAVHVVHGRMACAYVVNLDEKIYAAPLVTSFAGHGALDVVVSTMEGHVHAFKAQGSRFHPTAFSPRDHVSRYDSFGVVLHERDYRVMRGSRVDVSYEIIDRRALDHAKASVTSHAPYVARFSLTTLDGFERTVSATHARCGKFTVRVPIPSTRARGEIRVVVVDALGVDAEDAYSTSFHDDYESALKWLVAGPFLLATVAAIRRADRDALELDVLGASIPTSTQGLHEE